MFLFLLFFISLLFGFTEVLLSNELYSVSFRLLLLCCWVSVVFSNGLLISPYGSVVGLSYLEIFVGLTYVGVVEVSMLCGSADWLACCRVAGNGLLLALFC